MYADQKNLVDIEGVISLDQYPLGALAVTGGDGKPQHTFTDWE